jgi:hypothetical protein
MKMTQAAIAALISLAAVGANAATVASTLGVQSTTAFMLTDSNVAGGKLLTAGESDAAMPVATIGNFLAGEPDSTAVVTLGGVGSVSFDWGTPDSWNELLVGLSDGTSESFLASTVGLSSEGYVTFTAGGASIDTLSFIAHGNPAFEAANFSVTAVPEPENLALLVAGLGLLGVMARRRRV